MIGVSSAQALATVDVANFQVAVRHAGAADQQSVTRRSISARSGTPFGRLDGVEPCAANGGSAVITVI